jgi:DNA-binding PadR family transcriptional regulator
MYHRPFFPLHHHHRMFEKGALKYIILDLVKDKPSHGYEIMRALEEKFHGFYSPSAGSVYPTLQMLEDMDYVSSSESDGKKVYTITEKGKQFLDERQEHISKIKEHMKAWSGLHGHNDFHEALRELRDLWHLHRVVPPDSDKWNRIKEVIARTRKDIEDIISKD